MKDRYFFPLAAVIIAAIIGTALSLGERARARSVTDIIQNGFEIRGDALKELTASPGTRMILPGAPGETPELAVLYAHVSHDSSPGNLGVFAALGPEYENAFGGRNLRVSVRARQGKTNPSNSFEVAYYSAEAGNSQWQMFNLTPEFETYDFEFHPRVHKGDPAIDYFAIWPSPEGQNKSLDIEWLKVDVVDPDASLKN